MTRILTLSVAAIASAALLLGACGGGGSDKTAAAGNPDATGNPIPRLRTARARRKFQEARQDQLALSQMSVLVHPVDVCGARARARHTGTAQCATPAGLARVPGSGVRLLAPNAASIQSQLDPNVHIRVLFGSGAGQVEVRTGPRGWTFVSRSLNGNVFRETKRRYGSRVRKDLSLTCTKRGRGFCPGTGNLLKPGGRKVRPSKGAGSPKS
jgi:hypothetical protein